MRSIAHVINPFKASSGSDSEFVQPIVFESMRKAKDYSKGKMDVQLCTVQYIEDREIVPDYFTLLPDLTRSVVDVGVFSVDKKLPLTKDILQNAINNTFSEYIVYTNADIVLMPFFYEAVNDIINQGYDAFIINRRRIIDSYNSEHQLNLMYAEVGKTHLGYDCFVFKRELFSKFILSDACVGIPYAWNDVVHNLFCFSSKFKLFTQYHLTFHIGMDLYKNWGSKELTEHNKKEFIRIVRVLKPLFNIEKIPGSELAFFKRHFKWLMNPTFHYPTLFALDLQQLNKKRERSGLNKKRTIKQRYLEWLIRYVNFD